MKPLAEREALCPSLALVGLLALAASPPAAEPTGAHEDLSPEDASSLAQAYRMARRSVRSVDGGHRADHPGQSWRTFFDGRGFSIEPDAGDWTWGLELESWGFAGSEQRVSGHAAATARGERLTYVWGETLEEWYVNGENGLEHGYTVHDRPPFADHGAGPLTFTLAVRGELRPRVDGDGRGARFADERGAIALVYGGLFVLDADGRELDAGLERRDDRLRLWIDERGARYPLTIDPTAQQAYLKASNTGSGDLFGGSVAISGDTAVVGAKWEDSAAIGVDGDQGNDDAANSGAAYVFVRNGVSWSQQAYLKASNTDAHDEFGTAVAVSDSTVIVGAPREDSAAQGVDGDQGNSLNDEDLGAAYVFDAPAVLGTRYCSPATANSTGIPGRLLVFGSPVVADDELLLRATGLPILAGPGTNIGYFLMGTGTNTFTPPGSMGQICIAPGLLRFLPPTESTEELVGGGFERTIGTSGPVSSAITAGSTWNFQAWHRDGAAFSTNLTDAVSVAFQ